MRLTSRARTLATAGFVTTTLTAALAAFAAPAAASTPPVPPPASTLPPLPVEATNAGAPATTPLVDDSRTLTIEVPTAWGQVVTAPGTGSDGSPFPQIVATTDLASFENSFDTSGVIYAAQPLNPDTAAALTSVWDFSAQCTDGGTEPYADAYFTGTMQTWTACAGGQAKVVTLFATPMDQRFSVALLVGIAAPADEDALGLALASFFVTKPQGAPSSVDPAGPTPSAPVPSGPVPTGPVPTGPAPTVAGPTTPGVTPSSVAPTGDGVILEDDTATIGVGVPAAWTQVNTSPATGPQGDQVPAIAAAPDLTAFQNGAGVGVFMVAAPYAADPQTVLPTMMPQNCQGGPVSPYQDSVFTGVTQRFDGCNGVNVTLLVANRQGNTAQTIQIITATAPGDDTPLDIIAATFDFAANAN